MNTAIGLLAILFFSTGVAFSRSLSEQVGALSANAFAMMVAGVIGLIIAHCGGYAPLEKKKLFSRHVIYLCLLFATSQIAFYLAIGLASSRKQAILAGLINYLWCGLSILFSIPLLKKKAGFLIIPGILIALTGVTAAVIGTGASDLDGIENMKYRDMLIYALALVPAVAWALYSNLCRKWSESVGQENVPLFLLFSGLVLAGFKFLFHETFVWRMSYLPELLLLAVVPILLAYLFWNWGIRKGNFIIIVSFSYFIPVLSVFISCLYLKVQPTFSLAIGAVLVLAGSAVCKYSIKE